jgi:hypothetical protein
MLHDTPAVIRSHRFEVLDDHGRVRAILAAHPDRPADGTPASVALEIRGEDGTARAWLVDQGADGVQLALAIGGNQRIVIEAAASSLEVLGDVSVVLCDLDGIPALSWRVAPDGSVITSVDRDS